MIIISSSYKFTLVFTNFNGSYCIIVNIWLHFYFWWHCFLTELTKVVKKSRMCAYYMQHAFFLTFILFLHIQHRHLWSLYYIWLLFWIPSFHLFLPFKCFFFIRFYTHSSHILFFKLLDRFCLQQQFSYWVFWEVLLAACLRIQEINSYFFYPKFLCNSWRSLHAS
jgi:hypothetical protein